MDSGINLILGVDWARASKQIQQKNRRTETRIFTVE